MQNQYVYDPTGLQQQVRPSSQACRRRSPRRSQGAAAERSHGGRREGGRPSLASSSSTTFPGPCGSCPSLQRVADKAQETTASNALVGICNWTGRRQRPCSQRARRRRPATGKEGAPAPVWFMDDGFPISMDRVSDYSCTERRRWGRIPGSNVSTLFVRQSSGAEGAFRGRQSCAAHPHTVTEDWGCLTKLKLFQVI